MSTSTPAPSRGSQATRRRLRKRVPPVLQLEATECGAACLGMILESNGSHVPLEDLRIECGVSRDGSNARNLVRAARHYGLVPRAYKREPEQLKEMTFPLIAHWRFYHFVVVEGWFEGGWYITDPATGPRRVDDAEFDESFTGVAIELVPGPDFVPRGKRPGVYGRLSRAAGRTSVAAALATIVGVLLLVPTVLIPRIIAQFGNGLAGQAGLAGSVAIAGLLIALLIQAALLGLQGLLSVRFAGKVTLRLTSAMVYRLLRLPAAFHAQRGASVLGQRALVAESISGGISALVITAGASALTSVTGAIVLLFVDPLAGLAAILIAVIMVVLVRVTIRRSRDDVTRTVTESIEAGALVSSALNQIEPVKASGGEDGIIAKSISAEYRLQAAEQAVASRSLALRLLPGILGAFGSLLITFIAAGRILAGDADPGSLLAVIALAGITIGPVGPIVVAIEQAQNLRASLDQVDDVLSTPEDPELTRTAPADAPDMVHGRLTLRDVSFGYSPVSAPTVTNIDLDVMPGHRVALVGPSGCGKSTISRIVTGLYEPWTGEVLIDDLPREGHDRVVLTSALSLVDQDVTIFAGTIRDNVTLWDASIPDEDVQRAIADAQLAEDVARRPGGLDSVLSEGGADLSGGQRQRLEIARAIVRNPAILVMDEATSALDPLTEQRIDLALRRRGITCLVIAHRLSTIRDSDEIVVLDRGNVVERGTHDELLERGGPYASLVASL